jgi:hydroxyacylglutathione hydrolase
MTLLKIALIPSLTDNYTPILIDPTTQSAVVVDPSESAPVLQFLEREHLAAQSILITHHHGDHIGGVKAIAASFPRCKVIGSQYDQHRLPPLTKAVQDGDVVEIFGQEFQVWHMPGHTRGHIIYVSRTMKCAFVGDVIFGSGCGRVFEGTYEQMFQTLQKFKTLPPDFTLYCAHEYTEKNVAFALERYPENTHIRQRVQTVKMQRDRRLPTVPLTLGEELLVNPFLWAQNVQEFGVLRDARNIF